MSLNVDIDKLVRRIDTYLTVLRLSGNYKERQRINLSNQELPVFCEKMRQEVLAAVARGALATAFLEHVEAQHPTQGGPLPEQFARWVATQLEHLRRREAPGKEVGRKSP